jgi:broad specificity polyphosphatase/5'/3'-nucleotidase SurE
MAPFGQLVAHGGTVGLAIEVAMAGLIVAIALAAWVGARKDKS